MVLESSTAIGVSSTESFVSTLSPSMSTSGPDSFVPENLLPFIRGCSSGRMILVACGNVKEWDFLSSVSVHAGVEIFPES